MKNDDRWFPITKQSLEFRFSQSKLSNPDQREVFQYLILLPAKNKGAIFIIMDYHKSNSEVSIGVTECHLMCIPLTFGMVDEAPTSFLTQENAE